MARACAGWQARRYGWEVPPAWITPAGRRRRRAAGRDRAVHAARHARWCCPRPPTCRSWPFPGALGRELIQVPMVERRRPADYDLDGIAAAFDRGARLVVHVNPHNPLGRVFTVEEQLALAEVVERRGRPGLLRRDPRAAGVPGRRPPPLRLAVAGDGRGTPSRRPRRPRPGTCPGLKTAQLILSNDDDVGALGRVGFMFAATAPPRRGCSPRPPPTTRARPWLDDVLALPGRQPAGCSATLLAERLPQVRYTPARGHLPGLAGLPASSGSRARPAPSSSSGPASPWSTARSAARRARATCG